MQAAVPSCAGLQSASRLGQSRLSDNAGSGPPAALRALPLRLQCRAPALGARCVLRRKQPQLLGTPAGLRCAAAAADSNGAFSDESASKNGASSSGASSSGSGVLSAIARLDGLWSKFLPMSGLFFLMAYMNTIVDSLKDTLVITAVGGGAHVIPFLTTYGVLPCSMAFLAVYSRATSRFSRETLFNGIVVVFLAFFAAFGFFLYPNHGVLHLDATAQVMSSWLPTGLQGLVGMVCNWTFSLFFCMSELWGDVGLSLLFWGLANDTTTLDEAPILYPLFGIGANVAQALAGITLARIAAASGKVGGSFAAELRVIMGIVLSLGVVVLVLHRWISRGAKGANAPAVHSMDSVDMSQASMDTLPSTGNPDEMVVDVDRRTAHDTASGSGRAMAHASTSNGSTAAASNGAAATNGAAALTNAANGAAGGKDKKKKKKKSRSRGLRGAVELIQKSPQIRCLAVMSIAQGVCTNLMEFVWKSYLRQAFPTPQAYGCFMGEVAMYTGITTGCLMFISPILFDRFGWLGVAGATPRMLLTLGTAFIAGCLGYSVLGSSLPVALAPGVLQALVMIGALLYVSTRSAKFSLFKPAEEMVYIGLDAASRTRGKAAVDVVGAQMGKSSSSVMQQVLLLVMAGSMSRILPILLVVFLLCVTGWSRSVEALAEHHLPDDERTMGKAEPAHDSAAMGSTPSIVSGADDDCKPAILSIESG